MFLIRRCIRAKAFQMYFSYGFESQESIPYRKAAEKSMLSLNELHATMLALLFELRKDIEDRKQRYTQVGQLDKAKEFDRFIRLTIFDLIEADDDLMKEIRQSLIDWHLEVGVVQQLSKSIVESEAYKDSSLSDKELMSALYNEVLFEDETLLDILEMRRSDWVLDVQVVHFVLQEELNKIKSSTRFYPIINRFGKKMDDVLYVRDLVEFTVNHKEKISELIKDNLKNWELDRVARVDLAMLELAIGELLMNKNVTLKIVANEYVELSKWFSNEKSPKFINGMIAGVVQALRQEGHEII